MRLIRDLKVQYPPRHLCPFPHPHLLPRPRRHLPYRRLLGVLLHPRSPRSLPPILRG